MPNKLQSDSMDKNKALLEQLSSEYKILQDKIDKIGAFKFTIRGWSVTIVAASGTGAATAHLSAPFLIPGLIVLVFILCYMEHVQSGYRRIFQRRSADIERWIWRLLRQGTDVPGMVPRIAHELGDQAKADIAQWDRHPRAKKALEAISLYEEWVFGAFLSAVILLTACLWPHQATPDQPSQSVQYNMSTPATNIELPSGSSGQTATRSTQNARQEETVW